MLLSAPPAGASATISLLTVVKERHLISNDEIIVTGKATAAGTLHVTTVAKKGDVESDGGSLGKLLAFGGG